MTTTGVRPFSTFVENTLNRFVATRIIILAIASQNLTVKVLLPAVFIFPVTLSVILAAAMADTVSCRLGIFFSLFLRLAKVVEIDDLGHASAPSLFHGIVAMALPP